MALPRVETTFDKEKRASFKEQLAAKLVDAPEVVTPEEPITFNGVGIGGTLYHDRFGAGTLLSVGRQAVNVRFGEEEVSFVPFAATSVLSPFAPKHPKDAIVEDPFIGDTIVRPLSEGIVPAAEFEAKPEPIVLDPQPLTFNGVGVGGTLHHPVLGAGTVVSLTDSIVELQFAGSQVVEFTAKTSKAILTPHAPVTPKEDKFEEAVFGAPIVRQADVVIPGEAERAAALKAQLAARISDPDPEPQPEPDVRLNGVPVGGTLYHIIFGEGALLSVEPDEVTVLFERGEVSFVPSAAKGLLSPFPYEVSKMDRFDEAYVDPIVRRDFTTLDGKEVSFADTPAPVPAPTPAPVPEPVLFNDVAVGGTLYHPTLGAGTLVSFDKNDVVMDFGFENGPVALPSRQAKQLLSPHAPKPVIADDVPDEGSYFTPIVRQFPDIEPVAEFDAKPEPQSVPVVDYSIVNGVGIGGTLYHPSMGKGTLVSADKNEVVLAVEGQELVLAARQAQKILSPFAPRVIDPDTLPEVHFPPIIRMSDGIVPDTTPPVTLASSVETPEIVEAAPTLNGVGVGGTVYHEQFGKGTLKVISKTEVAVEFAWNTVSFVPSSAVMLLSPDAPSDDESRDRFEDSFIEPVVRSNPVVNATTRLIEDPIEIPQEPVPTPVSLHFAGQKVWHPDFGPSKVVSVDPAKNEIVLEVNDGVSITLALRALESKLAILPEDTDLVSGKKLSGNVV